MSPNLMSTNALGSLLGESLDYAGIFPPAELSLAKALRNYLDYQRHPQSWLLGRFVCPVARLAEFDAYLREISPGANVRLAVLGRLDKAGESAAASLKSDLDTIAALNSRLNGQVRIGTYESLLPLEYSPDDPAALAAFVNQMREQICGVRLTPLTVFLEIGSWGAWEAALVKSAEMLVRQGNQEVRFGWKIRLGGARPLVTPTASDLAQFVAACRDTSCVWKATAGLHQPLCGGEQARSTFHPGFLTLLAAATLAQIHDLPPATIQQILEERDRDNLHFDMDAFAWRKFSATRPQITAARQQSLISFGSCSFEEPLEGLRELHLLEGIPSHA